MESFFRGDLSGTAPAVKRPHRPYRIGMRAFVSEDGLQWIDMYLMRHRACVHSHSFCLDTAEDLMPGQDLKSVNQRRFAIVWGFMRDLAKKAAIKANRKKRK